MALPLAVVYRSLAQLHGVGIPWPQAVERATGGKEPRWQEAAYALGRGASAGDALAGLLPPIDLAALRAGEASGRLEEALHAMAARHEDQDRRARDRKAAIAYPIVIAHLGALLLPVPDLVAGNYGAALLWSAVILVPVYAFLFLQKAARKAEETGDGPSPPWTKWFRTRAAVEEADARALWALGWLHDAGVAPLEALPLAASAGAGGRAAADFRAATLRVRAGGPITTSSSRLPPEYATSILNGEATGHLSQACLRAAASLESSAAYRREKTLALVKPLSIAIIGLVIGARVILFYVGMYRQAGVF